MPQGFDFIADRIDREVFAQAWKLVEREAQLNGLQVLLLVTPVDKSDVLGYEAEACRLVVDPTQGAKGTIRQLLLGLGFHFHRESRGEKPADFLARHWAEHQMEKMVAAAIAATRCAACRKDGEPCRASPQGGSRYCSSHQIYRFGPDIDSESEPRRDHSTRPLARGFTTDAEEA